MAFCRPTTACAGLAASRLARGEVSLGVLQDRAAGPALRHDARRLTRHLSAALLNSSIAQPCKSQRVGPEPFAFRDASDARRVLGHKSCSHGPDESSPSS
jgi:hypothetical protein